MGMMGAVLGGVAGMFLSDQPAVKGAASKELLMLGGAAAGHLFEEDGMEPAEKKEAAASAGGAERKSAVPQRKKTPYERRLEAELVKMHQRHENNLRLIEAAWGEEEEEEAPPVARRSSRLVPVGYATVDNAEAEAEAPRRQRSARMASAPAPAATRTARRSQAALPDYGELDSLDLARSDERVRVFNRDAEDIFGA